MTNKESNVRLGEGVSDELKKEINDGLIKTGKELLHILFQYVNDKVQGINIDDLFSKKNEDDILKLWSSQLVEKGMIPNAYAGLLENLLIDNLHQVGYLDGMYVGYALALMSLAENNASKDLILAVRDDIRPNLIKHHYNDRDEFIDLFKSDKYSWINSLSKENSTEE